MIVDRVPLLVLLRSPLFFPEYVFRFELGVDARDATRDHAADQVARKRIGVQHLTLSDLDRIASFDAPRKIGLGELACAVIAERLAGGVLCDDWRAKAWLEHRMTPLRWDSIEWVLLDAAAEGCIGELDLVDSQRVLERNQYSCRGDLQLIHLQRQMQLRRESTVVDHP
ncbi:MAG TPA: hypothetical protein VND64_13590 [Pirellulales bacterium]|nr:hypothetical protein [Pirellulales bacterium]